MKLPFSNQQFATYLIFRTALRITELISMMRTEQLCAHKPFSLLWIGTRDDQHVGTGINWRCSSQLGRRIPRISNWNMFFSKKRAN